MVIVANGMISMDNSGACLSGTINCTNRILLQCKLIIGPLPFCRRHLQFLFNFWMSQHDIKGISFVDEMSSTKKQNLSTLFALVGVRSSNPLHATKY